MASGHWMALILTNCQHSLGHQGPSTNRLSSRCGSQMELILTGNRCGVSTTLCAGRTPSIKNAVPVGGWLDFQCCHMSMALMILSQHWMWGTTRHIQSRNVLRSSYAIFMMGYVFGKHGGFNLQQNAKCQHPGCGGKGSTICSITHLPPIITIVKEEGFDTPQQKHFDHFLPGLPNHWNLHGLDYRLTSIIYYSKSMAHYWYNQYFTQ